jgi:hypothetical protein
VAVVVVVAHNLQPLELVVLAVAVMEPTTQLPRGLVVLILVAVVAVVAGLVLVLEQVALAVLA